MWAPSANHMRSYLFHLCLVENTASSHFVVSMDMQLLFTVLVSSFRVGVCQEFILARVMTTI